MGEEGSLFDHGFARINSKAASKEESTGNSRDLPAMKACNNMFTKSGAHTEHTGLERNASVFSAQGCTPSCKICSLRSYLDSRWYELLKQEFEKAYMKRIVAYLHNEKAFYPPTNKIFAFSKFFGPEETRVVILGQDPYHNADQAMGLAFSVPFSLKIPPSLKNIFRELKGNYGNFHMPSHGDLSSWARQGVLLLNDSLTVRKNAPNSHSSIGWQNFTHGIVSILNARCKNLVFILWGSNAQKIGVLVDHKQHLVLKSAHPSPYSADRGFFGSRHFIRANEYLIKNGLNPIDWSIGEA